MLDNFIPYLQPGHKIGKVRTRKYYFVNSAFLLGVSKTSQQIQVVLLKVFLGFAFYLASFVTIVMLSLRCHGITVVSMTFRCHNNSLVTWVVYLLPWYCFRSLPRWCFFYYLN